MNRSTSSRYASRSAAIGRLGYPAVFREFEVRTERKTQVVNITDRVRDAVAEGTGGAAALVYVPHTTAGVTINEHIDPDLLVDLESALERIVSDEWSWRHEDADGA